MGLRRLLLIISKGFVRWRPNNYLYKTTFGPLLITLVLIGFQSIIGMRTAPGVLGYTHVPLYISRVLCGIGDWKNIVLVIAIIAYLGSVLFYLLTAYLSRTLLRHPLIYWFSFGLCTNLIVVTEAPLLINIGQFIARIVHVRTSVKIVWLFILILIWFIKQVIDLNVISRFNVHSVHILTVSAVLDTRQLLAIIKLFPLGSFFSQIYPFYDGYIYIIHSILLIFFVIQMEIFASITTNILSTFMIVYAASVTIVSAAVYILSTTLVSLSYVSFYTATYLGALLIALLMTLYKYTKYYEIVEHFIRSISFMRFLEGSSMMGRPSSKLYALLTTFIRNCNERDGIPIHRFEASYIQLSIETQKATTYFNTKIFLFSPAIVLYLVCVYYPMSLLLSFYECLRSMIPSKDIDLVNLGTPQKEIVLNKEYGIVLHARGQQPSFLLEQFSLHNPMLSRLCEIRTHGMDTPLDRHLIKLIFNLLVVREKKIEMAILGFILLLLNDSATKADDYRELACKLRETSFFRYIDVYSMLVSPEARTITDTFFMPQNLYHEHCIAMYLARKYAVPFTTSTYAEFGQILTIIFTRSTSISHIRILYSAEMTMALDFAWSYFASPWVFIYFGTILEIMLNCTGMAGNKRYEEQLHQKTLQFAALNSKKVAGNQSAIHQDATTLFNFVSLAGKNLSPAQYFFKTHLFSLFPKIDFKIFELESVYQEVSYASLIYDTLFPYIPSYTAFTIRIQGQGTKGGDMDSAYLQQRTPDGKDRTVIITPYVPTLYNRFERGTLVTIHTYSEKEAFTPFSKCRQDEDMSIHNVSHLQLQFQDNPLRTSAQNGNAFQQFLHEQKVKYDSLENSEYTLPNPKEVSGDEVYLVDDGVDGGKLGTSAIDRWGTRRAPSLVYDLPPAVALSRLIKYYAYINTSIGQNTFQKFIFGKRRPKEVPNSLGSGSGSRIFDETKCPRFKKICRWKKPKKSEKQQDIASKQPFQSQLDEYYDSTVSVQTTDTSSSTILGSQRIDQATVDDPVFPAVSRSNSKLNAAALTTTPILANPQMQAPNLSIIEQLEQELANLSTKDDRYSVHELLTGEKLLTHAVGGQIKPETRVIRIGGVSRDTFSIMTLVVLIDLIEHIYTFEAADNNSSILTVGNTGHIFVDTLFKNNFLRLFRLLSGFIVIFKPLTKDQGAASMYHNFFDTRHHKSLTLQNWALLIVLQLIYNEFCVVKKVLSSTNSIKHRDQSILFMYYGFLRSFNFCPKDTARFAKICGEIMPETADTDRTSHMKSFLEIIVHARGGPDASRQDNATTLSLHHIHNSGINTSASQSSIGEDNSNIDGISDGVRTPQRYDPQIDHYSDTKARRYMGSLFDSHGHREHQNTHENNIFDVEISKKCRRQIEEQIAKRADGIRNISIIGKKVTPGFIPGRESLVKGWTSLTRQLINVPHTNAPFYISLIGTFLFIFATFCVVYFYIGDMWAKGLTLSDYLDLLFYKYIHTIRLWSIDKQLASNTRGKWGVEMRKQYETIANANLNLSCFHGEKLCNEILNYVSQYSLLDLDKEYTDTKAIGENLIYNSSGKSNGTVTGDNITNYMQSIINNSFYQSQLTNLFPLELYEGIDDNVTIFLNFFVNLTTPSKTFQEILSGVMDPKEISSYISITQSYPILSKLIQVPETLHWLWKYQAQLENYIPRISISPSIIKQSKALPPTTAYTMSFREYADLLSSLLYLRTYLPDNERFHIKIDDSKITATPLFDQNIFETALQGSRRLVSYATMARSLAVQYLFDIELPINVLMCMLWLSIIISAIRSIQFRKLINVFFKILGVYQQLKYSDIARLSNAICFKICDFVIQFYDINALQMILRDPHVNKSSSQSRMSPFNTSINTSKLHTKTSGFAMQTPAVSVDTSMYETEDTRGHGESTKFTDAAIVTNRHSNLHNTHLNASDTLPTMLESRLRVINNKLVDKLKLSTPLCSEDLNDESPDTEARIASLSPKLKRSKWSKFKSFCYSSMSYTMSYKVSKKTKEIRKKIENELKLPFMQRVFVRCPCLGIFLSYKSRLEALERTYSHLNREVDRLYSLSMIAETDERQITESVLKAIEAKQYKINYRCVTLKRKADNIRPAYIFLLLFLLSLLLLVASIHVLGCLSTTLIHRTMSSKSTLLLTRKLQFFQHMLNYLEAGIYNIRTGSKIPTYKEAYTNAAKHLNVEGLESMFSEFNAYNIFPIPLTSYAKILAPCSNLFYALKFLFEPVFAASKYIFIALKFPFLYLSHVVTPTQLIEYTRKSVNVVHHQLNYHSEIEPTYSVSTILTYYKLLRYFIDVSNTMLELPAIKEKDSSYDFVAINYNINSDSADEVLRRELFNSLAYDTRSLDDYLESKSSAAALSTYFSTPSVDASKSWDELYKSANKVLDMSDFRSLFHLFSVHLNKEIEAHLAPDELNKSLYDNTKRALQLYLLTNLTDYMVKDGLKTIRLVDLNLSVNFVLSIISFFVLLMVIIPLALYCSLYISWSFKHLLSFDGHNHGFNSKMVRKYIKSIVIIGILSAGIAGFMLISLSILNLVYAGRIDRQYALVRSLHKLSSYHLRYRRDSIASFLDQPVAYSSTDVFKQKPDRFDTIYHESLSLLYYYGFFIPHLNRREYYNASALKEDLEQAVAAGYNETSYISELHLYNSMPSYSSYAFGDFPISIQEYIYAARDLIIPNMHLIRWNENLGNAKFTQGAVEDVLSSFYSFAEQKSFSILIQKYLRDNYILAFYQPTPGSNVPPNHVSILDSTVQMHLNSLNQANMEMEYSFCRLYDGIMSLFVQKQKEYNHRLEIKSFLVISVVLLTLVSIAISIMFSSLPIYTVYIRMLKDNTLSSSESTKEVSAIEVEMMLEQTGHMVNSVYNMQMDEHAARNLHRNDKVKSLFDKIVSSPIVGTKQLFLSEIILYTMIPMLIGAFGLFFLWGSLSLIFMYAKYYSISSYVKTIPMLVESIRYINQDLIAETSTHTGYTIEYSYAPDKLSIEEKIAIKQNAWRFQSSCDLHAEYMHLLRIMLESICYGSEYVLKFSSPSMRFGERIQGFSAEIDSTLLYWNQYESVTAGHTSCRNLYDRLIELSIPALTKITQIADQINPLGINADYLINITNRTGNVKSIGSVTIGQVLNFLVSLSNINITSNLETFRIMGDTLQVTMETMAHQINTYLYYRIVKIIIILITVVFVCTISIVALIWLTGRLTSLKSVVMFGHNILVEWKDIETKRHQDSSS